MVRHGYSAPRWLRSHHPYRWSFIGSLDHLASASLEDFQEFNKVYYVPNNATLVLAGDFVKEEAKKLIEDYFGPIPRGKDVVKKTYDEAPIAGPIYAQFEDANIQIPLILLGYRTPGQASTQNKVRCWSTNRREHQFW